MTKPKFRFDHFREIWDHSSSLSNTMRQTYTAFIVFRSNSVVIFWWTIYNILFFNSWDWMKLRVSPTVCMCLYETVTYMYISGFIMASPRSFIIFSLKKSKGRTALKWQILWETNKFQVSFCSPFKFVRRFFVENKRAIANNKGADQLARTRRLICAFVVRTCIKAGFLSDSP